MKRYIISIISVLLSLHALAEKIQDVMQLTTPNIGIVCIYDTEAGTATLGNGYNACVKSTISGEVVIPGSYTYKEKNYKVVVGQFAFRLCEGITKVTIEDGVEHIGDYAFVGCSKTGEIVLPSTLKTIGAGAFCNMKSLMTIRSNATTAPTWQWNDLFSPLGTKESMNTMAMARTLFVPKGSKDSYQTTKFDGTSTGTLTKANEKVGWLEAFAHILDDVCEAYPISTVEQLKALRDAVNGGAEESTYQTTNFILTADIDMAASPNWEGIGTQAHPFSGSFNGNGHVIKNMTINTTTGNQGLFGYAENATLYNMHLMNPVVTAKSSVGALLGGGQNVYVKDVLVTSNTSGDTYTVTATETLAGGLIGSAEDVTLERCMFQGKVSCVTNGGGLAGVLGEHSIIEDCMVNAEVRNTKTGDAIDLPYLGGIVGSASVINIENCFIRADLLYSITNPKNLPGIAVGITSHKTEQSTLQKCAYWEDGKKFNLIQTFNVANNEIKDNVGYANTNLMVNTSTRSVLGTDDWFYFTGNYADYPVPATLKDMFLNNVINKKDDATGLVFRMSGEGNKYYDVVGYTGDATEITIPETFNDKNVTGIEDEAFKDNATLTTIHFGSNISHIGNRAFYNCNALTAIDLPDNVWYVGEDAFAHCNSLKSFNIGTALSECKGNFLAYCPSLTTLTASRGNNHNFKCVDNVLVHCPTTNFGLDSYIIVCAAGKKGDYVLPAQELHSYIHFRDNCFAGCTELTSITFPSDKYYTLGKAMFDGAYNLRYIDMIGMQTLNYTTYNVDRDDENNPFYGMSDYTIIYLPKASPVHTASPGEPNVVIDGTASRLELDADWDFVPKVKEIIATDGVGINRSIEPLIIEVTEKTGEQTTLDNETVELMNGRYEYTDAGYTSYLPYSVTLTDENIKVYKPTSVGLFTADPQDALYNTTVITFTEVKNKEMEAFTPYFLVLSGTQNVDLGTDEPVTLNFGDDHPWELDDYEFKGSLVKIPNATLYDAQKPTYLLQTDGCWHQVPKDQSDAFVGPYRAYFQAASNSNFAKELRVSFKELDSPTGVDTIIRTLDSDGSERYYDINGRRLNGKPQRGLYIHNGKKIFAE